MLVQRTARHVVRPPERLRVALDRDDVRCRPGGSSNVREIVADTSPNGPATATVRVLERGDQRRHEVRAWARRSCRATTTTAARTRAGCPRSARPRDPSRALVRTISTATPGDPGRLGVELGERRLLRVRRPVRDDDQLGAVGRAMRPRAPTARARSSGQSVATSTIEATPTGALLEARRHRRARPVADDAVVDQVGCRGSLEGVQRRRVDHLPAGGLDLARAARRPSPSPWPVAPPHARPRALGPRGCLVTLPSRRGYRPRHRATGRRSDRCRARFGPVRLPPSGLIPAFLPAKAKNSRSVISNVVALRPERRARSRVAHDREPAALHRPVERLGDDAGADAREPAVVELGLAQDVEPQRRVGGQRVLLGRASGGRARRRRCRRGSGPWSAA